MKKKNPLLVRTPDKINQEYSDVVSRLGILELECLQIEALREQQSTREDELLSAKTSLLAKVKDLSVEMEASQAEEKRKLEASVTEGAQQVAPVHRPTPATGQECGAQ